jgi:hypothetical protein
VTIRTAEQALEFARLFTTPDTWFLAPDGGLAELAEGQEADKYRFVIPKAQFARCCVPVMVTPTDSTKEKPWFKVQRTVVRQSDYGVYSLTELVAHDGRLVRYEMTLLGKDGKALGTFTNPYDM